MRGVGGVGSCGCAAACATCGGPAKSIGDVEVCRLTRPGARVASTACGRGSGETLVARPATRSARYDTEDRRRDWWHDGCCPSRHAPFDHSSRRRLDAPVLAARRARAAAFGGRELPRLRRAAPHRARPPRARRPGPRPRRSAESAAGARALSARQHADADRDRRAGVPGRRRVGLSTYPGPALSIGGPERRSALDVR